MRNFSYENAFDLHENEPVGGTHFHMNGFGRRLVLTQRQKSTRKWPIEIERGGGWEAGGKSPASHEVRHSDCV